MIGRDMRRILPTVAGLWIGKNAFVPAPDVLFELHISEAVPSDGESV